MCLWQRLAALDDKLKQCLQHPQEVAENVAVVERRREVLQSFNIVGHSDLCPQHSLLHILSTKQLAFQTALQFVLINGYNLPAFQLSLYYHYLDCTKMLIIKLGAKNNSYLDTRQQKFSETYSRLNMANRTVNTTSGKELFCWFMNKTQQLLIK